MAAEHLPERPPAATRTVTRRLGTLQLLPRQEGAPDSHLPALRSDLVPATAQRRHQERHVVAVTGGMLALGWLANVPTEVSECCGSHVRTATDRGT